MNNSLAERFRREKTSSNLNERENRGVPITKNDNLVAPPDTSNIVSPEILRSRLLEKLRPKPQITMDNLNIELVHFASLAEFAEWYKNNRDAFSEKQQKPLDSLAEAHAMSQGGCNCNIQHRRDMANQYFRNFWIHNRNTDLPATLQKITKSKKIILGDFLSFPP